MLEARFLGPDVAVLDDEGVRRLLAPMMRNNAKVWAYASAASEPGVVPSDEVLLTETSGRDLSVAWVRHPGSFSGAAGHLLCGTDGRRVSLLRCWADLVFELADLVEARADRMPPEGWPVQCAYLLAQHLR
ncbi:hypothetical protein ACFOY4_40840 [Actinomadura syzygii]|uniref:Uncharacterized protein n=1 Tax=Actinomadura syzygii TaxID=1427538 RepID=A0A5D0UAI6_9ACTN|nr:hypothetical protein [Actinomadura syzygii]TYC14682.1 hypothetical protein FXF65_17820 [Actinomadura syzygii]